MRSVKPKAAARVDVSYHGYRFPSGVIAFGSDDHTARLTDVHTGMTLATIAHQDWE